MFEIIKNKPNNNKKTTMTSIKVEVQSALE